MKKITEKAKAFTLIELLVVISIIGILAALLLANFAGIRDRADDARLKSNLKQVQNGLRMRYNDLQSYPVGSTLAVGDLTGYLSSSDFPTISYYSGTADTFAACINLSNLADGDGATSRSKCGVDSAPGTNRYCVCSN